MPRFEVSILAGGRRRSLSVTAADETAARAALSHCGRVLAVRRRGVWSDAGIRLGRAERSILMIRLAALIESRIGLADGLRRLAEIFRGRLQRVIHQLIDAIETGDDLPTAFERLPQAFPAPVVALVRAGCLSGGTPKALRDAVAFEQEVAQIEYQSVVDMVTILFNLFFAIGLILGTTEYIHPQVMQAELFRNASLGLDLDLMLRLARLCCAMAGALALGLIGLILVATVGRRVAPVASDRAIAVVPFYRSVAQGRELYILLRKLSALIVSGVAIDDSLKLAADMVPAGAMRRDLNAAREALCLGQPWPEAMRLLSPFDRASLTAAEDRVEIARTLNALALNFKATYIEGLRLIMPILKGVSIVFVGLGGLVLFGLSIMPMLQVITVISR